MNSPAGDLLLWHRLATGADRIEIQRLRRLLRLLDRYDPRHRPSPSRDDQILTLLHRIEQAAQLRLGFGDAYATQPRTPMTTQMVIKLAPPTRPVEWTFAPSILPPARHTHRGASPWPKAAASAVPSATGSKASRSSPTTATAACASAPAGPRSWPGAPGPSRRSPGSRPSPPASPPPTRAGAPSAPACGTPLAFMNPHEPDTIDLTLASLDDPTLFPPRAHIWTSSQVAWLDLGDDLPRHTNARA